LSEVNLVGKIQMALYQLIYESRIADRYLPTAMSIFRVGRRNNCANRITGVVVLAGCNCFEWMEGEIDVIKSTFERIKTDHRHTISAILDERQISERHFLRWNTGFHLLSSDGFDSHSTTDHFIYDGIDRSISSGAPTLAFRLLEQFRERNGPAANVSSYHTGAAQPGALRH
jgi:hypothetical protein